MSAFPFLADNRGCYLVAEISANHNHSLCRAEDTVRAVAAAGADAVKLQTYTADTLTLDSSEPCFQISGTLWEGMTLYDLYRQAYTPWEWHEPLQRLAHSLGLEFFSTPFDNSAVDFLEELDVPFYKIASFEIVDIPLLQAVAATGKPVIVSTGMATLAEVDEAVQTLRRHGAGDILLLKCTSSYPAPPEEANLRTIPHMAKAFGCPAGLSDHTLGSAVAVAAVALGARLVEKHLTLSRADGGPDAAFSMEPHEFKRMVEDVRLAEQALGRVNYGPTPHEESGLAFRRSLFATQDIPAGACFTQANVRSIRPGHGLHPRFLPAVLGRKATRPIRRGEPLTLDMLG